MTGCRRCSQRKVQQKQKQSIWRPTWGRGYPKVPIPQPRYLPPSQVQMGGGGTPRYLPPPGPGTYPPGMGQHMEYLIRCGRYASCLHAGELSCCGIMLVLYCSKLRN